MNTRILLASALITFLPLFADAAATTSLSAQMSDAVAPVGTVGPAASELASFVLSAVALVVSGIALSRTKKPAQPNTHIL